MALFGLSFFSTDLTSVMLSYICLSSPCNMFGTFGNGIFSSFRIVCDVKKVFSTVVLPTGHVNYFLSSSIIIGIWCVPLWFLVWDFTKDHHCLGVMFPSLSLRAVLMRKFFLEFLISSITSFLVALKRVQWFRLLVCFATAWCLFLFLIILFMSVVIQAG